jgi:galactokinase
MEPKELLQHFWSVFGEAGNAPGIYFAPGRVNLIGEHTDYSGGFVFPCALQYGTYLVIRETADNMISLASLNFPEKGKILSGGRFTKQESMWFNYPLGVMDQFVKRNFAVKGMELLYYGDIPNNAGLSSSASIEMVTAFALNEILNAGLDRLELVKIAKQAENEFVGVNCGIMDMFAVGMGENNHAIFLNCNTLEYKLIPVLIPGYRLIIVNSNKKRGLADSKYNERVAECQLAVASLSQVMDLSKLGDIAFPQFFKVQERIPDEVVRRRARHVVSENQRVLNAVSCLLKSDMLQFGALMNSSHDSLKENYEVTGLELDTLVDEARKVPGVIGARMTGAGFGGCTVNLVREESVERFLKEVGQGYHTAIGLTADFYIAEVGDGVKKVVK